MSTWAIIGICIFVGAVYIGAIAGARSRRGTQGYLTQGLIFVSGVIIIALCLLFATDYPPFQPFSWICIISIGFICAFAIAIITWKEARKKLLQKSQ